MEHLKESFNLLDEEKTFEELFLQLKEISVVEEVATITNFFYKNYEQMVSIVSISRHPENKEKLNGMTAYEFIAKLSKEAKDFPRKDKLLKREEVCYYLSTAKKLKGLTKSTPKVKAQVFVPSVASPVVLGRAVAVPMALSVVHAPAVASIPVVALVEASGIQKKNLEQLNAEGWNNLKFGDFCKKYRVVYDPRTLTWNQELSDLETYLFSLAPEEKLKHKDSDIRIKGPSALKFGELYDLLQRVKHLKT